MNSSRGVEFALAGIVLLMAVTSAAMTFQASSRLQTFSASLLLATSTLAFVLLHRSRLSRLLRSPVFPPASRVVGGCFCLAAGLITSLAGRPLFPSFSRLNAAWLVLAGLLLVVTVLADWQQWGGGPPARPGGPGS